MLNGLGLFEGIGGITLALAPWVRPVAYCENERYAQSVLLSRIADGHLPEAPIWDDVRTLRACYLPAPVDIVYGGFPCQDLSVAGLGAGLEGKRSGLFFEILRLVDECEPGWVFLENVAAIRTRGAERVTGELARRGYDCRWTSLRASDVGAPHERNRWWLLAHIPDADGVGLRDGRQRRSERETGSSDIARDHGAAGPLADALRVGPEPWGNERERSRQSEIACRSEVCDTDGPRPQERPSITGNSREKLAAPFGTDWWATERGLGRVVARVPNRVDRLRCLGNAVVPLQARTAFQILAGLT